MPQPPQQPKPNVFAKLGGDAPTPWVTLRSRSIPLALLVGALSTTLATIDNGLEIVEDDGLGLRILPRINAPRQRSQVGAAVRQLTKGQQDWRVKWETD